MGKKYFSTAEEAQASAQHDYYRAQITCSGRLGGPDMPVGYLGDGHSMPEELPAYWDNHYLNSSGDE